MEEKEALSLKIGDFGCGKKFLHCEGNGKQIGEGWFTVNNSTRAFWTGKTVVLTHCGNGSAAKVNLIHTVAEGEGLAGRQVTFSVEARVLKFSDQGGGGVAAFINAGHYDRGRFLCHRKFENTEWETVWVRTILPQGEECRGLTLCLRAVSGETEHAEVEFRNPRLYLGEMPCAKCGVEVEENSRSLTSVLFPLLSTLEQKDRFLSDLQSVLAGFQTACRIVSEDQGIHYLVMNRHIGDVMRQLRWVILFRDYYSGKESYHFEEVYGEALPKAWIVKKVIIVTNTLLAGVTKLYSSVEDVVVLSSEELNCIDSYAKSGMCVHENLHQDEYCNDHLKSTMYGISSYNWTLDLPMNFPNKNERMLGSVAVGRDSLREAERILSKTDPWKTVILCPYARSTSMLPEESWNAVISALKVYGFEVYTNVGPEERELKDTLRLQVPVDVFTAMGKMGCIIIGVQSGIMDLIRWVECDIRIICLSILLTPKDKKCAKNRQLKRSIEHKGNIIHLLIQEDEIERFPQILLPLFSYFRKGNLQKERAAQVQLGMASRFLEQAEDLNEYIKVLSGMEHVMVLLAVCGRAWRNWRLFERKSLGLECDLSVGNASYGAVVDWENGLHLEKQDQKCGEIRLQGTFLDMPMPEDVKKEDFPADNLYYVTSHAQGNADYTKAAIVINGQQYSLEGNGINLVVYDRQRGTVIDSICVDLDENESLRIRRKRSEKDISEHDISLRQERYFGSINCADSHNRSGG